MATAARARPSPSTSRPARSRACRRRASPSQPHLAGSAVILQTLTAATTGERSVFIDTWPWSEPDSTTCVKDIAVGQDGQLAYATVHRTFATEDENECFSSAFVSIDNATAEVTPIYDRPADDGAKLACRPNVSFDSRGGRLLMIEPPGNENCQGNAFALHVLTGAFTRL